MDPEVQETMSELARFREQWLSEVAISKTTKAGGTLSSTATEKRPERRKDAVSSSLVESVASRSKDVSEYPEDVVEPRAYHDLPDEEEKLKLEREGQDHHRHLFQEPSSALEHYEHAVEKETRGQLGDSIKHYRKAFKMDSGVHEAYKKKYFPPSSFVKANPTGSNPSNAPATVPPTNHHSLHGSSGVLQSSLEQMVDAFSELRIQPAPPPTDASPQEPCLLADLPEEILSQILTRLASTDVASFARMARVCKRLAYLVLTEESIWRTIAMGDAFGFTAMHYDFACGIEGFPLEANDEIARYLGSYDDPTNDPEPPLTPEERRIAFSAITEQMLHTTYASSWRQMFRTRPRIRFNGCYISTVNYTRPGATSSYTLTWGNPVHVVTYYRYLRFFRDGSAISLLTTTEPVDVVHHLTKENLHDHHGTTLPSSVMKDALCGRWRLSGPSSIFNSDEPEGDLHVETEGVVPKYTYKMLLALAHSGKGARNNKLAWKGYWSYNRLTDDKAAFGLKNDRAFYWSRVKSYGTGH